MQAIYTETPVFSLVQNVKDALVGKEDYPVEIVPGGLTIQLLAAGIHIGNAFERLEGSQCFKCHLRGPIRRGIVGVALTAVPCYVKVAAGGLAPANSADKCCGIAVLPLN